MECKQNALSYLCQPRAGCAETCSPAPCRVCDTSLDTPAWWVRGRSGSCTSRRIACCPHQLPCLLHAASTPTRMQTAAGPASAKVAHVMRVSEAVIWLQAPHRDCLLCRLCRLLLININCRPIQCCQNAHPLATKSVSPATSRSTLQPASRQTTARYLRQPAETAACLACCIYSQTSEPAPNPLPSSELRHQQEMLWWCMRRCIQ